MPVFDTSIQTKFVDGGTDLGGKGWVLREYIIEVYPYLVGINISAGSWSWGRNLSGKLGDNTQIDKSSPVQTIAGGFSWKKIACGDDYIAAIKTDGTLWSWGRNSNGQLGDNTSIDKSSPVQTIDSQTNWAHIACGGSFSAAIRTDGSLWSWGSNTWGQLGDNSQIGRSSPVQTIGDNWKQVSCGYGHTAAIKHDSALWLWGLNGYGQLGDGTTTNRSSPVQSITAGSDWKQVACGYGSAAVKFDGSLWSWGVNDFGQIGDNTRIDKSSPVQTIAGGGDWKQVACGYDFTAATKINGSLWLWGKNDVGQLGDNSITFKSSPVQTVVAGTSWIQVSCGFNMSAAIFIDL
jgi:alpha-tubulin suppressor-like RCC1 family protein